MQGMHIWISGRVQGVSFRASTKKRADVLGLTGFVRNLDDGRVEIKVFGDTTALQQFLVYCRKGPLLACVSQLEIAYVAPEVHAAFTIS